MVSNTGLISARASGRYKNIECVRLRTFGKRAAGKAGVVYAVNMQMGSQAGL